MRLYKLLMEEEKNGFESLILNCNHFKIYHINKHFSILMMNSHLLKSKKQKPTLNWKQQDCVYFPLCILAFQMFHLRTLRLSFRTPPPPPPVFHKPAHSRTHHAISLIRRHTVGKHCWRFMHFLISLCKF